MTRFTYTLLLFAITSFASMTAVAQPGWGGRGMCRTGENDSLRETITLTGTIVIVNDTAFCNGEQYYLDTDGDGIGDYRLSFGPFWYSPSGMTRPTVGTTVTVVGFVNSSTTPAVIRVYTLDGQVWRDTAVGPPSWGGGFAGQHGRGIHAPDSSFCRFPDSAWGSRMRGMGQMGRRWSDSVHTRFDTCLAPFWNGPSPMKAWNFTVSSAMGSMMMGDGSGTSYVQFNMPCSITLRYEDGDFESEDGIIPHYYDGDAWVPVEGFTLNTETNTVAFEQNPLYEFYGLTANAVTSAAAPMEAPGSVMLEQNYPNPFNPSTTIPVTLQNAGDLYLAVYNAAGKLVATLADGTLEAGRFTFQFNAAGNESGVYFYRLTIGGTTVTRAMTLLK